MGIQKFLDKRFIIVIDSETLNALKKEAAELQMSTSAYIRMIIKGRKKGLA